MDQERDRLISSLYETQYDKLYKVGYRLTGDAELTQDLIQDVFLLALFRREQFTGHPKQEAWLMKVLTNFIKNERRKLSSRDVSLEELFEVAAPTAPDPLDALLPSRLPQEARDVLIWRFEQRLDYREIATRLGISESGCRDRVARAVKRCRELLVEV